MNRLDSDQMSKEERLKELSEILALGILRRHQIQLDTDPQVEAL
ncbi:MAG: hypothetical protein V3W41_09025 [Planctomycetota bacterium]